MPALTSADLRELIAARRPPCVSVYQHTQRTYPNNEQDPIQYRDLLRQAEDALRQSYTPHEIEAVMGRFRALGDDRTFWTQHQDGLAVFGAADFFRWFALPRPVPNRVVAADAFAVKPLVRMAQSADRFQVLCLTRHGARLLEGDRDRLHEIEAPGVPKTIEEALGGGPRPGEVLPPSPSGHAPRGSPSHHAQKGQDVKLDTERFFRAVDKAVWEHVSRPSGLPLVVAALPENQAIFRAETHNQNVLPGGVEKDPEALTPDQLREMAWPAVEERHARRLAELCEDFRNALAHGKATDDLRRAAEAAHAGRVGWALLDADRTVPGVYYAATGQVRAADPGEAADDDLLDAVGEAVLRTGGRVTTLPGGSMPTATGVAAVFRY